MDNLTHSLVGALLGQAGLKRKTGLAMPALIIGANLPDIDATCVLLGNMQHLALRRGITHGPIAWVVLPLVLAGALRWFDRWQTQRGTRPEARLPLHFGWLYALSLVAFLSHPALDWLNNYGIRLLEPFSDRWFYGDAVFIIDVWIWAGLGFALWLSLRREGRVQANWRNPAIAALSGALVYVLANVGLSAFVVNSAPRTATGSVVANPVPIAPWRRVVFSGDRDQWLRRDWSLLEGFGPETPIAAARCAWPSAEAISELGSDPSAFLFWARMPFAARAPDGSVVIHDARFYDPRMSGRFSVALPEVRCVDPAPD